MTFFNIIEDISNRFNGQIPNLIFFAIGIVIGIILFLITFLIVYLVSKNNKIAERNNEDIVINNEYLAVIASSKDVFEKVYKDKNIKEKLNGIIEITLNMLEEISTLYYPNSNDPMFEISIEQLVDFLDYFANRLELIIDDLLEEKFHVIESFTKIKVKDTKISKLLNLLNKKNTIYDEKKKDSLLSKVKSKLIKSVKKVAIKLGNNTIDYTFETVIDDLGKDINKLYSNQKLIFTDISKKQLKLIQKQEKKAKKNLKKVAGDDYA